MRVQTKEKGGFLALVNPHEKNDPKPSGDGADFFSGLNLSELTCGLSESENEDGEGWQWHRVLAVVAQAAAVARKGLATNRKSDMLSHRAPRRKFVEAAAVFRTNLRQLTRSSVRFI